MRFHEIETVLNQPNTADFNSAPLCGVEKWFWFKTNVQQKVFTAVPAYPITGKLLGLKPAITCKHFLQPPPPWFLPGHCKFRGGGTSTLPCLLQSNMWCWGLAPTEAEFKKKEKVNLFLISGVPSWQTPLILFEEREREIENKWLCASQKHLTVFNQLGVLFHFHPLTSCESWTSFLHLSQKVHAAL